MRIPILLAAVITTAFTPLFSEEPIARKEQNVSVRNEVQLAIDKGLAWLKSHQNPDGSWSSPEHPALTALPLIAFYREPGGRFREAKPEFLQKGYGFLRSNAKPDGGIYGKGLANYNTSVALMAMLTTGASEDESLIRRARDFIVAQQATNMPNPDVNGGIGYGATGVSPKRQHPDLDNTVVALEALRAFRSARPTVEIAAKDDLNWSAAIDFISRTQNLPTHNPKASDDPANRGGFVYYPGFSNADPSDLSPDAKRPLRSYGSMSYAGLLSFIYADLKPGDPRLDAALDWLKKNYSLEENPGLQRAGLFYYYHLMAKGLAAARVETMETADGRKVDWARELALKLIDLQNSDGSWVNDTARWMEKDPALVTSYCILALETIFHRL